MSISYYRCLRFLVAGIVQGVGFRPFVYNLAREIGLSGSVANTGEGVDIVVCGNDSDLACFARRLRDEAPSIASIEHVTAKRLEGDDVPDFQGFVILESLERGHGLHTLIPPDIATCPKCVAEILDVSNRRFDYPFTNCTECGPRFTIIEQLPYDRKNTSMREFVMCDQCRREYENPQDRRFHAQPNACPTCGPLLTWHDSGGKRTAQGNSLCLDLCAQALADGKIVAIKGLGGFHLAVNALDERAVSRLRKLKKRPHKPLAVMVPGMETARRFALIDSCAEKALASSAAPIVLIERIQCSCPDILAPGVRDIGIMLAYTPLHHLLFLRKECPELLVMTSGNPPGEPICKDNAEALQRLEGVADFFLMHNRKIVTRTDDSVIRMTKNGVMQMLRRSRGFVPIPVDMNRDKNMALKMPSLLACGAELKNTFTLSRHGEAIIGQHVGDLKSPATLAFYESSVSHLSKVMKIRPEIAVCDRHPDYLSSSYARNLDIKVIEVQHHHAHAAAVMAEHGLREAVAVILDGTGLGSDGTVWGFEFLHARCDDFVRMAHLRPLPMPGGDAAAREIWRMGISLLHASGSDILDERCVFPCLKEIGREKLRLILEMMKKGVNSPLASSAGRLFDAVAWLLTGRNAVSFEAQAAMELEAMAEDALEDGFLSGSGVMRNFRWRSSVVEKDGMWLVDYRDLVRWLEQDVRDGVSAPVTALDFHIWLVSSCVDIVNRIVKKRGCRAVVLGGGCFQNRLLLELFAEELDNCGYCVYTGEKIPVNDGGISLGQAYVATAAEFQNN